MIRTPTIYIIGVFSLFFAVCSSSCILLRPLPLKPTQFSDSAQDINQLDLSRFNGNYQIYSVDTNNH